MKKNNVNWKAVLIFELIIMFVCIVFFIKYKKTQWDILMEEDSINHEVILWHDKDVEAAIKRQMDWPLDDEVTVGQAKTAISWLNPLTLEGENIENLEDLKYFQNLKQLVLKDTSVTDLTPLLSVELVDLEIDGGRITDIGMIAKLKSLLFLSLNNISIDSLQPLAEMDHLCTLTLKGLPIEDISALSSLKNIGSLTLQQLPVTDVSALIYLRGLRWLTMIDVPIESLPPLSNSVEWVKLERTNIADISGIPDSVYTLYLIDNPILDLRGLNSLEQLVNLYIEGTDLSGIKALISSHTLSALSIVNCNVSDISIVGVCKKLKTLDLGQNELENMDGIERFDSIERLFLRNNKIQKIDSVENLPYLQWLDLTENPVQDLSPLSNLYLLGRLELSGINLEDIKLDELLNAPDLEVLYLSDCGLKDIKFMEEFDYIHGLDVSNNQISDINEIKHMYTATNEVILNLSYNPIKDITPLESCEKLSELNLSGIDLKNVKGFEVLQNLHITTLTAENSNLDDLSLIKGLAEVEAVKLNVSENHITDEHMKQIGAIKVGFGRYHYGRYTNITIQK